MGILRTGATIGVAVHHSAYQKANNMSELMAQASLFNGWHKSKSWAEDTKTDSAYPYISYHYLMATDGSILNVTDEKYVKYHAGDNFRGALSFNLHGISICLTGNYETDVPTDAQMRALVLFIRDIEKRYKIDAVLKHYEKWLEDGKWDKVDDVIKEKEAYARFRKTTGVSNVASTIGFIISLLILLKLLGVF